MSASVPNSLDDFRLRIQRIERHGCGLREAAVLPFGVADIDDHLASGGLAVGALHEVFAGPHVAHDAAMILFVSGILARLPGPVLWCLRQAD